MRRPIPPLAVLATLLAGAAAAQGRAAPDYFVEAVIALQAAERVATGCPALTLNAPLIQSETVAVMERLAADGFDITRPDAGMTAPGETFAAAQAAFLARHGLEGTPGPDLVCAAGQAEIAAASRIGSYLLPRD